MPKIEGFEGKYKFLSNFYPVEILVNGITYPSVEHAYVAAKTEDKDIKQKIAAIPTAAAAKKFGRTIELPKDWGTNKILIMLDLLIIKFENDDLRKRLKNTEGYEIIEENWWHDNFWGDCDCSKCDGIKGQNVLGKLLMKVRTAVCVVKQKDLV